MIGNGVPNITFPVFTTSSSVCPILAYEIFDKNGAAAVSTVFKPIVASQNVTIQCIATNCSTVSANYSFQIKITNKALGVKWIDVDSSGIAGTIF